MGKIIDHEKLENEKSKKKIAIIVGVSVVAVVAIVMVAIVALGIFKDFDAQGYTHAMLDQTFQGKVTEAANVVEGQTEEELYAQYEAGVESFVANNIINGVEMDAELKEKYVALCREIFAAMKYDVKEAEKISRKEYQVPVEYQTTDIFPNFVTAVAGEHARLQEKVDKGEYQGATQEEIQAQIQADFLNNSYELLHTAYEGAQYAEPETMIFTVKEDENGLFTLDEAQIYEFITKIMGLDEIQD